MANKATRQPSSRPHRQKPHSIATGADLLPGSWTFDRRTDIPALQGVMRVLTVDCAESSRGPIICPKRTPPDHGGSFVALAAVPNRASQKSEMWSDAESSVLSLCYALNSNLLEGLQTPA